MPNHRRVLRSPRDLVCGPSENSKRELERYLEWVAMPETRRYLQLVLDEVSGAKVDNNNPYAGQDALCKQKKLEGAEEVISMLLNLDDAESMALIQAEEPSATWGADE